MHQMHILWSRVVALSAFCLCAHAQAQTPSFYVGASLGGAYYDIDHDDSDQLLFDRFQAAGINNGVIYDTYLDRSASAVAPLVGMRLGPYFALEASYLDIAYAEFGAYALQTVNNNLVVPVKLRGRIETRGPTVTAIASYPWREWDFYARAGAFFAKSELDFHTHGAYGFHSPSTDDKNTSFVFGPGAAFHFTRHLTARVEWQYLSNVGELPSIGKLDVGLFNVGVLYEFGSDRAGLWGR
jgi:opacity protein-like surface antigen